MKVRDVKGPIPVKSKMAHDCLPIRVMAVNKQHWSGDGEVETTPLAIKKPTAIASESSGGPTRPNMWTESYKPTRET